MSELDDDEFGMLAVPLFAGARHLDAVGKEKHGVLIEAGGLPQAELNHLQRTIAVVLECGNDSQRAQANALLQHLASRCEIVIDSWGSANPSDFVRPFAESGERAAQASAGLALLYRPARFSAKIKRWIDAHYRSLPLQIWNDIYARVTGRAAR